MEKINNLIMIFGVIVLSGCAAQNTHTINEIKDHGFIESYQNQIVHGKDGQPLVCNNKNDESFSFKFITEKESVNDAIDYIPVVNLFSPLMPKKDTKIQHITYNDDLTGVWHYGVIPIDGKSIDVFIDRSGFTKNDGALTYIYSENDKIHAFKTESGIIPHLENFYNCHYQGQ